MLPVPPRLRCSPSFTSPASARDSRLPGQLAQRRTWNSLRPASSSTTSPASTTPLGSSSLRVRSPPPSHAARRIERQQTNSHVDSLLRAIDRSQEAFSRFKTRRSSTVVGSGCEPCGGRRTACRGQSARIELSRCVQVLAAWSVLSIEALGSLFASVNDGGGASDDPFSSLTEQKLCSG